MCAGEGVCSRWGTGQDRNSRNHSVTRDLSVCLSINVRPLVLSSSPHVGLRIAVGAVDAGNGMGDLNLISGIILKATRGP